MKRLSGFWAKPQQTRQLYAIYVRLSSTDNNYGQCEPNSFCQRSHHCGQLNSSHIGQQVELCGWLKHRRLNLFMILRDTHGTTQVTIPRDERLQNLMSQLSKESVLRVVGTVQPRPEDQKNKDMVTGDVEVLAEDVIVLSTAGKTLPFQVQDFHKVTEPLRMEYRYLDLRNSTMQRNLRLRSQMVMKMRDYLCTKNGFIEVETPTLFRKTPGGAREFVVPTHHKGKYYSLPQSPQQFKQLLMVGGIDRYMQIAKCYRDETANPDRQPEFTQVDLEMSFVTPDNVKGLVEGMLAHSWPEEHETLVTPFPVMNFDDAIREYGSDKPDTRFELKLQDISKLLEGCNPDHVSVLEAADNHPLTSVQALNFKGAALHLSNKDMDRLKKETHIPGVWNAMVRLREGTDLTNLANLGTMVSRRVHGTLNLKAGDVLLLSAGPHLEACMLLGRQRLRIADMLDKRGVPVRGDKNQMNYLWVENFPLFMKKEGGSGEVESAHHPFTAPHPEDIHLVYTCPEKVRGLHYDLVLNGSEIGGGSIRIHDASLQRHVLADILREDTTALEHLLKALESGCPPHGGIALGLDRLVAIACGASCIRDVIAFPKSIEGRDLMAKSPAPITDDDRHHYHLATDDDSS